MDRPRRSARASHAPELGYPSPTVQSQAASPAPTPPSTRQSRDIGSAAPAGSSNAAYSFQGQHAGKQPAQQFHNVPDRYINSQWLTPQASSMSFTGLSNVAGRSQMSGAAATLSYPLGRSAMAIPPQTPIGPGQARLTTFASRARLGLSTLAQPLPPAADGDPLRIYDSFSERSRASGSRRRAAAGRRYYGEDVSDFDDDDDDQNGSPGSPSKANTPLDREEEEEPYQPGALLGLPPPGNKVIVKRAHQAKPICPSEADLLEQADRREFLIPIKLDLESDTHRIRDTFTWNIREHIVKPRDFAKAYVRDMDLPSDPFLGLVESAIDEQIKMAEDSGLDLVYVGPAAGGPFASNAGKKRKKEARNWDWGIRQTMAKASSEGKIAEKTSSGIVGDTKASLPTLLLNGQAHSNGISNGNRVDDDGIEDDLRVILDYDVQIYRHHLRDRLEWDLCSPLTPEAFAKQTCKDLCLTGEAQPAIANAIREQLLNHLRSAIDLDLIGKGAEFARWQNEIDDAEREIAENIRRLRRGLPVLPRKPLRFMQEEPEEDTEVLAPRRRRNVGGQDDGEIEGSGTVTPMPQQQHPSNNVILRTPEQRKSIAEYFQFQLTEKGPRKLEGVWREYQDSREFGPLLEMFTDADLERLEADAIRASRRGRREQHRNVGRSRRR